jgi:hypothetical protein
MPDPEGKTSGEGTKTPDQAYKSGRPEDIEPGSLGASPEPEDTPAGQAGNPREGGEKGSYQSGGFTGDEKGGPMDASGEGDASPQGDPDTLKTEEAGGDLEVGEGAKNLAPGELGDEDKSADEIGQRGYGQQPDYDANDPEERQAHPKTPSDMGSR